MILLDLLSCKIDTRKYSVRTDIILRKVVYYRQRELHPKLFVSYLWWLLSFRVLFLLETSSCPACFIHLHSMKLHVQTPAVSVGSLVCGNDLFFCRNTNLCFKSALTCLYCKEFKKGESPANTTVLQGIWIPRAKVPVAVTT